MVNKRCIGNITWFICISYLYHPALAIYDGKRQLPSYLLLTLSTQAANFCCQCFFHTYNFFVHMLVYFSHRLKWNNEKNTFLNVLLNVCRLCNIESFMKRCYLSHNVFSCYNHVLWIIILLYHSHTRHKN